MGWFDQTFGSQQIPRNAHNAHNAHGQAITPRLRASAIADRQVDELIGLVKGVLADGAVCPNEVRFLLQWMEANREAANMWPAKALYPRLAAAMADGHLDDDEEREVMSLLLATVGGIAAPSADAPNFTTTLPLCSPVPAVEFNGRVFCFTGRFHSGTRDWCEAQVVARGGRAVSSITRKLNYLVIGELGSRDWMHSTHGRKIEKAVSYRDDGVALRILSEQHWYEHIT